MWRSQHSQIKKYIKRQPKGTVFVLSDFFEIAEPKTVSKIMERLTKDGVVNRVRRGVFWKPDLINDCPNVSDLISALARIKQWEIVPTGDTALHAVGFLKKKPRVWTYLTNGSDRDYEFNGEFVSLQHYKLKNGKISPESRFLVEIIKACGAVIPEEIKVCVRSFFSSSETKKIIKETKYMTKRIAKLAKDILKRDGDIKVRIKKETKVYE